MKKGWQTKKLGDVCAFDKAQGVHRGLPYVGLEHIESRTARFIGSSEAQPVKSSTFRFSDDHVLYGRLRPYLNKALAPDFDGHCSTEIFPLKPSPELSREYLLFWLLADETCDRINATCTGARMPRAQMNDVLGFEIPVPPLAEQQRIVGLLDEAFEGLATAKANAEKNLQNARALFESHLQSVFTQRGPGWVEKPIGELCERLHQGLNTAGEKVKFYDSGYPIIQTRNIDDGVVELDSKMKFMSEEDWQLYKDKYRPEIGDVFFTNIGTIGKTAIVTTDRDYLIHWNIFKLRPLLGKVTSEFLRYTLEQLTLSGYFEKLQKGGTVDFVTKKMISEALILLPAIAEQKTIVAKLDDLREETQRLARLYERKLAALEALKKSLLHRAFAGEL